MILGAHESAAGSLHLAFERAGRDGAAALQLWTRSSRQWAAKPLTDEVVAAFRQAHRATPMPTAAHASYLINLAAPDAALWARSTATLLDECRRAERLGVAQVIVHPGASQGAPIEAAVARVAAALASICGELDRASAQVRLLLEVTAGQGSCVGRSFAELGAMLDQAASPRLGVCLDTQHLFAAGVDWTTPRGYDQTFADFEARIGLPRLEAFHLNDSKKPLGARVDRHACIGDGVIGLEPFRRLLLDPRFAELPGYLETPPLPDGSDSYAEGLRRLRSLLPG